MSGLRDQLLKTGLINDKQVKKIQKQRYQELKGTHKPKNDADLQRALSDKQDKDRELNQQRKEQAELKALSAQITQLITTQRIHPIEGDMPYHFNDGGSVKKLYLLPKVRDLIISGRYAIVKHQQCYHIVPRETAEKIRQRESGILIVLNELENKDTEILTDDPYEKFQVPDDLIW